jgi:fused signal recognition particle receptor
MGLFDKIRDKVNKAVSSAGESLGFDKLKQGLEKTRNSFIHNLEGILGIGRKIDDNLLEEIEDILISADIGVATSALIIDNVRQRVKNEGHENANEIFTMLKEEIYNMLIKSPSAVNDEKYGIDENNKPHTILVIGVNGVGKTTTIGKLAYNYKNNGIQVLIGAADTFRAAANEQLEVWAERAGVPIIQQAQGADPASVAFDTLKSAQSKNYDVVIIDTAGRLHNKGNLMYELSKINRVMKKLKESAPDDVFLILDATTGQNALQQAKEFTKVANVTGIILTKLDGTAKGGIVLAIANELKIPVRYIGVGEQINHLQVFDPVLFVEALFGSKANNS